MTAETPIRIEGLSHSFGKGALRKQVLFDISTEISRGQTVIVTGPSGSGKTTLLTVASALRSVQSGSVKVLGQELNGARPRRLERVRRQIGFIFQQHNLVRALTAVQNVELGLRLCGRYRGAKRRRRAREFLEHVGLGEHLHLKPEQLSGGQRQRVAIARALAAEPAILMADEPTASLDKKSGRDVVDRMQAMAREHGTTILLVTHDNRILDIADRIVHLEDGRLSTFTDAVIDNSQRMMRVMHDVRRRGPQDGAPAGFDYRYQLVEVSLQAERILALEGAVNPFAYRAILTDGLRGFTRSLREALDATGAAILDAEDGGPRQPLATDPSSFTPRNDTPADGRVLETPLRGRRGQSVGVVQVSRDAGGQPFDAGDGERLERFAGIVEGVVETLRSASDPGTPMGGPP